MWKDLHWDFHSSFNPVISVQHCYLKLYFELGLTVTLVFFMNLSPTCQSLFVIVLTVPNPSGNPIDNTAATTSLTELSWTAVICLYLPVKLLRQMCVRGVMRSTKFYWVNNCGHMTTQRLVRCDNNSLVIRFIWRWSLSPLVPFVRSDVDACHPLPPPLPSEINNYLL